MAILNDNVKPNFDTPFIANFDVNQSGNDLNPQPLNLDDSGNLMVNIQGGNLPSIIYAQNPDGQNTQVQCDNSGILLTKNAIDIDGKPAYLNLDDEGNVKVVNASNVVIANMFATQDNLSSQNVHMDNHGALDAGGTNTATLGDPFSQGNTYANITQASAGVGTLRTALKNSVTGHNYTRMYNYSESIIAQGTSFYVVVSCWGGN